MEQATLDAQSKPYPAWASIPIILLCLGVGGWLVHWYILTGDSSQESRLLDSSSSAEIASFTGSVELPIEKQDANTWYVRNREAVLVIDISKAKAAIKSASFRSSDIFAQDVWKTIVEGRGIVRNPVWQKTLKITPDQLTQLRQATGPLAMVIAPADNQRLLDLWNAYQSANASGKDMAQNKLLSALTDIARKSVDATRQLAADRAKKITASLTDSQWKQYHGGT